ncbi:MAG: phenylacetate--CoA ligase [Bacillati bacterium ANGP1]|uniref:Phenylacetate--CoA ligase n=1 Tax=Candidatus Segetimicrobium genomatis TaxID=2569760 RepID=A0A537M9S3_9BACT|nr:MAG: phenylacetate--CoA ligase [Terrabacteria group bacterium ANGP1]
MWVGSRGGGGPVLRLLPACSPPAPRSFSGEISRRGDAGRSFSGGHRVAAPPPHPPEGRFARRAGPRVAVRRAARRSPVHAAADLYLSRPDLRPRAAAGGLLGAGARPPRRRIPSRGHRPGDLCVPPHPGRPHDGRRAGRAGVRHRPGRGRQHRCPGARPRRPPRYGRHRNPELRVRAPRAGQATRGTAGRGGRARLGGVPHHGAAAARLRGVWHPGHPSIRDGGRVAVEVVDPETERPAGAGVPGEVVVSLLEPPYALLRFGTGDLAAWEEGECPCGRTAPRLAGILGRVGDAVKIRGLFVHPSEADRVVLTFPEVVRYQIVVTRPGPLDEARLFLELRPGADAAAVCAAVASAVHERLRLRMVVEAAPAGAIGEGAPRISDRRDWR